MALATRQIQPNRYSRIRRLKRSKVSKDRQQPMASSYNSFTLVLVLKEYIIISNSDQHRTKNNNGWSFDHHATALGGDVYCEK